MDDPYEESQNVLFVYFQEDMRRFWVFDGQQYLHFAWPDSGARFVRTQPYLPANTLGVSVPMTPDQRRALEGEAARHHLRLPFFDSEAACDQAALGAPQDQYILDRTLPGGYFFLEDLTRRRRKDGEME
jgi:hypothetical protein